jgi:predicted O-linked N-acetylglucosamine transferase (SPINDLY family)
MVVDMSGPSTESGTAGGVPQSILQQANPDCDTCVSALTRAHKRYQEKMEAIRNYERLEKYYKELEFEYKNYRLTAERKIKRFEQNAAGNKAALENSVPLEEHNAERESTAICGRTMLTYFQSPRKPRNHKRFCTKRLRT